MRHLMFFFAIIVITILVPGIVMAQIDLEKYPANPVLELGADGSWDDVHTSHPSVLFDGSTYHLWYVGDNGSLRGIGYARSNNGVVWEKYPGNPLLTDGMGDVWDGEFVSQPSVLYDGTQYRMWYAGYDGTNMRIGYATSDDGIAWNKNAANPVLDLGEGGAWDAMGLSSPTVMYDGTQYRMWYAGYDGSSLRIGYATSADGVVWNKDASNPVLDLGASGLWDAVGVSGPTTVMLESDNLRMWYTGYDGANMRIGLSYLGCPDAGSGEPLARLTTHAHANPAIYEATSENGAEVTIDGSQSIGSDGNPIVDENAYEWDFDYDGDFQPEAIGKVVTYVYSIGEYTAALRVTDSSESNIDTVNIKVQDTSPPIVKLLTPYGGEVYQGGGAVTIRWEPATDVVSLQNNAIALYYNSDGGDWQLIAQDEANDGQYEWTAPVLDSDNIKVKIDATDAAGNIGSDTPAVEFTIDSQAPVVGLITPNGSEVLGGGSLFPITWQPATDNFGLADAPISLSYSADDGANWELIAEGEGNDGQFDWNIPALDSENALVRVETVDRAGNVGADISDEVFVIDSSKPEPPALTPIDSPTLENVLTIEGTTEALSQVSLFNDGNLMGGVQAGEDGSFSFTTPTLSDGTHSLTATATDAAGNVSDASTAVDVLVDTVTPKRPIPLSPADGIVLNASPTLVWEAVSDATEVTYHVQVDDDSLFASPQVDVSEIQVDVSEIVETQLTPTLPDGLWFWQVQARDAVGHFSDFSPTFQFSLDTVAPDKPIIASPEAGAIVSEISLTISGTAEPKSHIDISDNEQPLGSIVADVGGRFALVIEAFTEGDHTLTAKTTDAAGNESETSQHSFSVDNTAPTVLLTYPNGGELFRGGDSIDITWEPAIDGHLANNPISLFYSLAGLDGWIPIAENEPNDGNCTWNLPQVNSQSVYVKITAVDVAGNIGEDVSDDFLTIDSSIPASSLTIIQPSKEQTQYLRGGSIYTILWSLPQDNFSLASVTLSYSEDGGNNWNTIPEVIDAGTIYGRCDWSVPTIDSNQVVIRIEATDASGNQAEDTSGNHVIDISAPDAPVLNSIDSPTSDNVLAIAGTAESESQVSLFCDEKMIADVQAATGSFSFTIESLADGLHSFTATAADAAGNLSEISTPVEVTVDTTPPCIPILLSPADGIAVNASPTLSWGEVSDATAVTYRVQVDDDLIFNAPEVYDITDAQLALNLSEDGIWYWQVMASDEVGHTSDFSAAFQFTLDTVAPGQPVINHPETGTITGETNLTISGTAEPESIVHIYDGLQTLGTDTTDADGKFALIAFELSEGEHTTIALDNGTHTFTATATDAAGNVSEVSDATTVTVDTGKPAPPVISLPTSGTITNQNVLTIEGTAETDSTITLLDNEVILGAVLTDASGYFSYTTPPLADGIHSFTATATDVTGNISGVSEAIAVTVDTVAPAVSVSLDKQEYTTNESVQITYTVDEPIAVTITTIPNLPVTPDNEILPPLPAGSFTVTATATDDAGNSVSANASSVVKALVARLDVIPNLFEIKIPKKPKKPGQPDNSVLLTAYLSFPEGISPTEIDASSLRLNDNPPSNTIDHDLVLEAQFEVDETFIASLLSLDVALIDKLEQNANDIRVFLNTPIEMASITLGKLQITGILNNQATFASEDASRQITLKESAAPAATRTLLAQNFPNPFNPETWIPYALASDAHVSINIFDVRGHLVRRLNLGYQKAGFYMERSNAAYWDGKNSSSQRVASGLYFYTLQSGEFKATRRMVIMK